MRDIAQTDLQEELLRQWAEQVKRSAVPVSVSMTLVAFMASQYVSAWYWGTWLLLVVAMQGLRWHVFRRLPEKSHIPVDRRVQTAVTINLAGTILHSLSLAWFPLFSPYQGAVQSMLIIGMGVGSVMMAAGYPPWARAHVFFGLVPMFSLWAWSGLFGNGGTTALFMAVVGIGYCTTIFRISDHIYRLYWETFETRRQLQAALEKSNAAARAKTRFLASASHDLRQPIHALALFSAALTKRQLDDKTRHIVHNMNTSIEALSYELDGLLDISKLDAGIVTVSRSNFCLVTLLRRLKEEFSPLAENRDIDMTLDCPERAIINTDNTLLERILRNLVTNAIHHNKQCTLTLRVVSASSDWQITVTDTGRGIDPSEHENIFEEFYQLENTERDRAKGLGLGLSIVSRLSELLNIKMELASEKGRGTQFTLNLPGVHQSQVEKPTPAPTSESLESLSILVVDDELSVREGMRLALEALGCRVATADSTDSAISCAMREKPNIALVDLRLRGDDSGLVTIDRLRQIYPGLPAIIVSGDTAPDRLLAVSKTDIPVLVKPVLIEKLKKTIVQNCFPNE